MSQHIATIQEQNIGYFTTGLIVTSLVLMASLAWNGAFESLVNLIIPVKKWEVLGAFIYALLLTAVIYYILKTYLKFLPKIAKPNKSSSEPSQSKK